MRGGKEFFKKNLILLCIFILGLIGLFILFLNINKGFTFTGFATYEQGNQSEFDLGTYNNTEYNGSAVVLSGNNLSGVYTSKIFDCGSSTGASWNNLSWQENTPSVEYLFAVDGGGDIYKSEDLGVTWVLSQENFGRTTDNIKDMFSNLNYLYILSSAGNEVWNSSNGQGFVVVYNDFGDKSPIVGDSDDSGNLYVITAPGAVWRSSDNAMTWIEQGDFNGDSTNNPKGISIDSNGYIFAVGSAGNVFKSIDSGQNWEKVRDDYGGSTGTDGMDEDSSNNLYILLNTKIYNSSDSGVSWSVLNDSISPYSNNLMQILIDNSDNFFVLDALGRVFKSTDSGVSWTEIGDCNNDATNDPRGITDFLQFSNLDFQVRSCDDDACSGESWTNLTDTSPQDLSLADNRYFQYKISFTSPDSNITPELYNVIIDYSVLNTAPIINLVEPENQLYTENESLSLNFSVSDADGDLDSCWYNLDNEQNITISNCQNTTFNVSEGSHVLTIYANDTNGELSSDSVSFNVDMTGISLSISGPTGTKSSRTGIPITYSVAGNNLTCWYNVKTSIGGGVIENTTLPNCSNSTFNVSSDGDFVLNIFVNNTLGLSDSASSSFSVSTSSPPTNGGNGGEGSSGGGAIISPSLSVEEILDLIVNPGDKKTIFWKVENSGIKTLNECKFRSKGNFSSWITHTENKNLAGGEEYEFVFELNVPKNISLGKYNIIVSLECKETKIETDFVAEILDRKLEFELIELTREDANDVKIIYLLRELYGIDQNVDLQFLLFDSNNNRVAEKRENKLITANSEDRFETILLVDPSLTGEVNFLVNIDSEKYSTFVQERAILGATPTGFALGNFARSENFVSGALILFLSIFAFFVVRRILIHRKGFKNNRKKKKQKK